MNAFEAWAIGMLMGGVITGLLTMIFTVKAMDRIVDKRFMAMYDKWRKETGF